MDRRLTGINPGAYTGVLALTPPDLRVVNRPPTARDYITIPIGTFWLDTSANPITSANLWFLASAANNTAVWNNFAGGAGALITLTGDTGPVVTPDVNGNIDIFGGILIQTTGGVNQLTVGLAPGNDGQIPIGFTGGDTAYANITAGAGITIVNAPNSITISAPAVGTVTTLTGNTGGARPPTAGNINTVGGGIITTAGAGSTLTTSLTQGLDGQIPIAATGAPTIYANLTSNDASITITNTPNGIDLVNNGAGGSSITITTFDVSGMWTKGVGTRVVEVYGWTGGGGGGSGGRGGVFGSGSGGAAGSAFFYHTPGAFWGATETVTIGAGGLGGAPQAGAGTNGNDGAPGGTTKIGNIVAAPGATPSNGLGGKTTGSGAVNGGGPQFVMTSAYNNMSQTSLPSTSGGQGGNGGSGLTPPTAGTNQGFEAAASTIDARYRNNYLLGTAGGGGGQLGAAGKNGGNFLTLDGVTTFLLGGLGGAAGAVGAAGNVPGTGGMITGGTGAGGGGGEAAGVVGAGGVGGFPGGGGGGGGGSSSIASGAGGVGGAGRVVVVEYA